jgi:large subunit ribosomal protein L5
MSTKTYSPRLADKYKKDVVPALVKKFGYKTVMQAPKLEKICLNRGVNGAVTDKKLVDVAVEELTTITGQKAIPTTSKKDISNFKLRKKHADWCKGYFAWRKDVRVPGSIDCRSPATRT